MGIENHTVSYEQITEGKHLTKLYYEAKVTANQNNKIRPQNKKRSPQDNVKRNYINETQSTKP